MDTLPSKIAELSALVNQIKTDIPQLRDHIATINIAIATLQLNTENLKTELKLYANQGKDISALKIELEHIMSNKEKLATEVSKLKEQYYELAQNSEPHDKNSWNILRIIQTAPNILAIITFLGWIVYTLFMSKMNGII